jgi:hypothetical protein
MLNENVPTSYGCGCWRFEIEKKLKYKSHKKIENKAKKFLNLSKRRSIWFPKK